MYRCFPGILEAGLGLRRERVTDGRNIRDSLPSEVLRECCLQLGAIVSIEL